MTALATSGTVDCSGLVSSILQRFRAVGARIAEDVEGDPGTVRAASQAQQQQSQQLSRLSQQARQRSTSLASSWEGGAYEAYAAKMGRTCDQLDDTSKKLATQSQKLAQAAAALDAATRAMTAVLADFDGKAQQMIALARTAAPGAVNAFVSAANGLGQSLVDVGEKVREELSRALDVLAGNDPTKPDDGKDDPKIELAKSDSKYGIDKFLGTDDLDELMGKKADPSSTLGKVVDKTKGTVWKWDNDGQPLWNWGTGDTTSVRTDLPGGGAAGAGGSYFLGPQVTADAKAGWEGNQASVDAGAKVTLADVKGNAYATIGPGTVQANGEAYVGAAADVNAKLGLDGGSLHAGAFAGGKIEGSVAGDVGGIGAGVNGSLRYGVGADVDAKATWNDGDIQLGFKAGAALGVGGSVGGNVEINLPKMWESYEQFDPVGAQTLRDGATWVGNTATEASHAIGNAADWLEGK